jgi:hypothetical protein
MKIYTRSSFHPADDIGIVEKMAYGLSGPSHHAIPSRVLAELGRCHDEILSQRATA